jgi:sortase (surface protein transpeptidase)
VAGLGIGGWVLARGTHPPRLAGPARHVSVPRGATVPAGRRSSRDAKVARPVRLVIPAIGVSTRLIRLGLSPAGGLQVPGSAAVAGWYTRSPRPGAVGASIIAGHIDSRVGPGVFFRLARLRAGQRVYVVRADRSVASFTIVSVRVYPKGAFPRHLVYGPVPDAELRLITCGGLFDYATGSYLSNVVVTALLVHRSGKAASRPATAR